MANLGDLNVKWYRPHFLGYVCNYTPSLMPTIGSSATGDADRLRDAMKGLGTNEAELIQVLGKRTWLERDEIINAYQLKYGKSLREAIHSETSGDFRKCLLKLLSEPAYLQAEALFNCTDGLGTDERYMNEVLLTSTDEELDRIEKIYPIYLKEHDKEPHSLIQDVEGDTSGKYKKALKLILGKSRDTIPKEELTKALKAKSAKCIVSQEQARVDASMVRDACSGIGTDEDKIMNVILGRTQVHLAAITEEHPKVANKNLYDQLEEELSGDFLALLQDAIEMATERALYYARLIKSTMVGLGTRDTKLMRLIILRSEIDMEDIKAAYMAEYKISLADDIKGDTSGDYQRLLLTLIGCN